MLKNEKSSMSNPSLASEACNERYPNARGYYVGVVLFAWFWIAVFCTFGIGLIAVPVGMLFGQKLGEIIAYALLAGSLFCLTGCVNAFWREYWYKPQARRRLERHGPDIAIA